MTPNRDHQRADNEDDRPSFIRVFNPDEPNERPKNTRILNPGVSPTDPPPAARQTLRQLYETLLLPDLTPEQRGTKEAFSGALNHWETRSGNPAVADVDEETARRFQRSMETDPRDYSADTIRKQWRYVSQILRAAKTKGWLAEVPKLRRLPTVDPDVRIVPPEHLDQLYQACATATWPKMPGISPADWWRCSLVLWRIYGFRCCELHNRLPWRGEQSRHEQKKGWPAAGIYAEPVCPLGLVRVLGLKSRNGWLVYTPKKQAWAKPAPLVLPLHPVARAHLDQLRGDRPAEGYVLPRTKANKAFNAQWQRLLEAAGIPAEDRFTRHDLRRTCESEYGAIGPHITGHAKRSVSSRYYTSYAKRIHRAIRRVDLPASWKAIIAQADDPRQKRLF